MAADYSSSPLTKTIQLLLLFILATIVLYFSKALLVPVAFAGLLAMVMLPLNRWFEKRKMKRVMAVLLSTFIFVAGFVCVIWLVSWQIGNVASDAFKMEGKLEEIIQSIQQMIKDKLGISQQMQEQMVQQNKEKGAATVGKGLVGVAGYLWTFIVDFVLVVVYLFLFLYYRAHIKKFILNVTQVNHKDKTEKALEQSTQVGQQYLTGLSLMILCLWVMYGVAFSIIGVKYALFFAILCGLLEMIPFVGNLTGTTLTVLFSLSQGADVRMVIAIIITYALVQFIQTYLIEPLVVGAKVNINPLFTILVLVAGEMVWGIPGLVLAIPLLAILKIIFDHFEPLKPYGELIGEVKKKKVKK
ncbi:MAG TPA: AI-2E family transporter [Chitinophagaceae bacterium]|nr:AI-2E family transporter [Chitinophagaceae bacterium]HML58930.1 AI-2E family transporter [Ferruginibacter sp.]